MDNLTNAKLEWALCHVKPEVLATEEDRRTLAYLREKHLTVPVSQMWDCFKERLLQFQLRQIEAELG